VPRNYPDYTKKIRKELAAYRPRAGRYEIQLLAWFDTETKIASIAHALTPELLLLKAKGTNFSALDALRLRGLLHLIPDHVLRKATAMQLNQESKANRLVDKLLEAEYDIDKATPYRPSTTELAQQTAPSGKPRYTDLYAELDKPVKLLAFDPDVAITGADGYTASGPTMIDAVAVLKAKCETRVVEFGGTPAKMDPPAWLNYQVGRGLVVLAGSDGKVHTIVSRFDDASLTPDQVSSIFTVFWATSHADEVNLYHSPDGQFVKKITLAKFGRLDRRAVRHKVRR
jgi:hypothetical protein